MILIRNVFHLKYGQAKPAIASMKEGRELARKIGFFSESRLLTDVTGHAYTMVLEHTFENLAAFEHDAKIGMSNDQWHAWYQKFQTFVDSGSREIFSIVE